MNKKAASILVMIFEVLAVLALIFILVSYAKNLATSENNSKIRTAQDIKMMIDVLLSVPGDAVVQYPYNISKYNFVMRQGTISVFEPGESEKLRNQKSFYLPSGYFANSAIEKPKTLCLEKKDKTITIRKCKDKEVNQ